MDVTIEDSDPCRKTMRVHAPPEAILGDYNEVVALYARQGKLPGFRKGKAPTAVVERRYGKNIEEDAKDRLVPRIYREALKQENVAPVAIVGVSDVVFDREKGLDFKVTLDVAPEFKLPKYKKITLKQKKIEVEEKQIGDVLDQIRGSRARYEDVTGREVRVGDLVRIDYRGVCEGRVIGEIAPDSPALSEGADFHVLVGGAEVFPGLSEGLAGAEIGTKRTIRAVFPKDFRVRELAEKEADYEVDVKGIRERVLPELDETLLRELKVDSLEALRERVHADLLEAGERAEQARLREEVARFLLDKTEVDLPQSIVEQETQLAVRGMIRRIASQGGTREQIIQQQDSILNAANESSRDRVKLSYILSRIADEEHIEVSDDEVNRRVEEMAGYHRMPVEQLRAELEKRNGMENLKSELRAEKATEAILEYAKIKS